MINRKMKVGCLQNFPFIEDDFDAVTDYELFSKISVAVKKFIKDGINEMSTAIDNIKIYITEENGLITIVITDPKGRESTTVIPVPYKVSQLENDSNFITKDVDDLTYYTKTSDLAAVATSGKSSDLINDAGFLANTLNLSNEIRIGTYNSKPAYFKIVSGTTPNNTYLVILDNVDELILSSGYIIYDTSLGDKHPINMTYDITNNYFSRVDYAGSNNKVYFNYSSNLESKNYTISLIYTKTTD